MTDHITRVRTTTDVNGLDRIHRNRYHLTVDGSWQFYIYTYLDKRQLGVCHIGDVITTMLTDRELRDLYDGFGDVILKVEHDPTWSFYTRETR